MNISPSTYRTTLALFAIACILAAAGCQDQREADGGGPEAPMLSIKSLPRAVVPGAGGGGNCGPPAATPSPCDWALANDAVILAEIGSFTPVETGPWVEMNTAEPILRATCTGEGVVADPSFMFNLTVHSWLTGEGPSTVTVRVGKAQSSNAWEPSPSVDPATGSVIWSQPGPWPLAVGSIAMFGITRDTVTGEWSLYAQNPVAIGPDWTIEFPENDCETNPVVPTGTSVDDFAALLSACVPSEQSESLRAAKHDLAPEWINGGYCVLPVTPRPAGTCSEDMECPSGVCATGSCAAEG